MTDGEVGVSKEGFKNKSTSFMLQSFAAASSFLCNIGAFVQTKHDLEELGKYSGNNEQLNNLFLGFEIL